MMLSKIVNYLSIFLKSIYSPFLCSHQGFAHKDCNADGNWFRHPETNKTWSNYTTCINFDDFEVTRT